MIELCFCCVAHRNKYKARRPASDVQDERRVLAKRAVNEIDTKVVAQVPQPVHKVLRTPRVPKQAAEFGRLQRKLLQRSHHSQQHAAQMRVSNPKEQNNTNKGQQRTTNRLAWIAHTHKTLGRSSTTHRGVI